MAMQTLDELLRALSDIGLPEAQIGDDNDGQVVIYTGLHLDGERLVEFDPELYNDVS